MTSLLRPSAWLRRVLFADAAVSLVTGLVMTLGASLLAPLTGLPAALLVPAGLALLPYAAGLIWLATRATVPAAALWLPVVLNLLWALDCAWVAFGGVFLPSVLGLAFVGMQALAVLVFAELEFTGLRRASGPATA